jgi:mycofactocin precursor
MPRTDPSNERTAMNHADTTQPEPQEQELVVEDLIEEVSIDGMCGVY